MLQYEQQFKQMQRLYMSWRKWVFAPHSPFGSLWKNILNANPSFFVCVYLQCPKHNIQCNISWSVDLNLIMHQYNAPISRHLIQKILNVWILQATFKLFIMGEWCTTQLTVQNFTFTAELLGIIYCISTKEISDYLKHFNQLCNVSGILLLCFKIRRSTNITSR